MQSVEAESELVRELVRSGDYNPGTVQVVPLLRSIMPQEEKPWQKFSVLWNYNFIIYGFTL